MKSSSRSSHTSLRMFVVLFLTITLVMGGMNARYLFRTELHEWGDLAANSLGIKEAKELHLLCGQYSRWGFHHPGPGWFYAEAAGEILFHDVLRIVPTPLNAQLLTILLINAGFLAAAITSVARWGGGWITVGLCLTVAALHLGACGPVGLINNWMPHVMVLPFACLVVTAASVGAGRGEDLPLLALAAAALLHSHVAQPLFVGPLFLLAYTGLYLHNKERPWRAFPRAHALVIGIVLLTALPVAMDIGWGEESNFALILDHRRQHPGGHHDWQQALFYCLRFVSYTPSADSTDEAFVGETSLMEFGSYLRNNAEILIVWIAATGLLVARAWRRRFEAFLLASIITASSLSVYWATIQDGEMFYFNSWFNYGLLLAIGFGAVGVLTSLLAAVFPQVMRSRTLAAGSMALAAVLLSARADRFRARYGNEEFSQSVVHSVDATLAADLAGRGKVKFLAFAHDQWPDAIAVALELVRRGERFQVRRGMWFMFGRPSDDKLPGGSPPSDTPTIWCIVSPTMDPWVAAERPLPRGNGLSFLVSKCDPTAQGPRHLSTQSLGLVTTP